MAGLDPTCLHKHTVNAVPAQKGLTHSSCETDPSLFVQLQIGWSSDQGPHKWALNLASDCLTPVPLVLIFFLNCKIVLEYIRPWAKYHRKK